MTSNGRKSRGFVVFRSPLTQTDPRDAPRHASKLPPRCTQSWTLNAIIRVAIVDRLLTALDHVHRRQMLSATDRRLSLVIALGVDIFSKSWVQREVYPYFGDIVIFLKHGVG